MLLHINAFTNYSIHVRPDNGFLKGFPIHGTPAQLIPLTLAD